MASERLALKASGQLRYTLKTPYRDGTTHIVLEPLDLMTRPAALVPPTRMHLVAGATSGDSLQKTSPQPAVSAAQTPEQVQQWVSAAHLQGSGRAEVI